MWEFLRDFDLLPITAAQTIRAAKIDADLTKRAQIIGLCDIWIAAAALEENLPVLTANRDHFSRVEGIQIISYVILS